MKTVVLQKHEEDILKRVSKAVSKDKTRTFMTSMCYDSQYKTLVATDGRRLHLLSGLLIDTIFGEITDNAKVDLIAKNILTIDNMDYDFPNWRRVVETSTYNDMVEYEKGGKREDTFYMGKKHEAAFSIPALYTCSGVPVSLEHLQDLQGGDYKAYMNRDNPQKPLRLVETCSIYTFESILMPLNIRK